MTAEYLDDLATILAGNLGRENLKSFVDAILGPDAVLDAANEVGDARAFARLMVDALDKSDRVSDAVAYLRRDAVPNSLLAVDIDFIARGGRLSDQQAHQAFRNFVEPVFRSADFFDIQQRACRTVCAIGLGDPHNDLFGTGFLIGPNLVMTNAHVIYPFLSFDGNTIKEKATGDQVYCFFDYLAEPPPKVPHDDRRQAIVAVTAQKEGWLLAARDILAQANVRDNCYDYAVIKLAKKIGNLSVRSGTGEPRGWLTLPETVDVLTKQRRVVVHQHPAKSVLSLDIGEYVDRDPTLTRVRYKVNTAKGSSGGAAVDSDGHLFALHESEVLNDLEKNQGVQIDLITKDLKENFPAVASTVPPPERPYWSLTDDLADPRPIIGRDEFRSHVLDVHHGRDPARVMTVWGPPGSGLRYTVKLLRRILGPSGRVAEFPADDLMTYTPDRFLTKLAKALQMRDFSANEIPKSKPTETLSRWARDDLPPWLAGRLRKEAEFDPGRYPAWLILHTAVDNFSWATNLDDLVASISGVHDQGQQPIEMPHLRILFLCSTLDPLPPLPGVARIDEDLSAGHAYASEFAECLARGLYAIDKEAPLGDHALWQIEAEEWTENLETTKRRKFLSEKVRRLILRRRQI